MSEDGCHAYTLGVQKMPISLVATFQRMRVLALLLVPFAAFAQVQIDLDQSAISVMRAGLVNGPNGYIPPSPQTDKADSLISQTKPETWRFSSVRGYGYGGDIYKFVVEDYDYPARFGTRTVLVLQDIFNAKYGKPIVLGCSTGSNCFETFDDLEQSWYETLWDFLVDTQDAQIDFYELMAEPDASFLYVSPEQCPEQCQNQCPDQCPDQSPDQCPDQCQDQSPDQCPDQCPDQLYTLMPPRQIYTLMKDAYALVKEMRPQARIVGPSLVSFKPRVLLTLARNMSRDGLRFDAISWHELGNDPDVVAGHVAAVRAAFKAYPAICNPSCPQIHINEYQGESTTLIPGYSVGWLSALDSSNVDQANRACWGGDAGSPIPYKSCWYGFGGLLMPDSVTPQSLFWVYKFYSDLSDSRFASTSSIPKIAAIAGSLDGNTIGLLVGNYGATQNNVQLQLLHFTQASAQVDVIRIPNTFNQATAMPTPSVVESYTAVPSSSVLTVPIASFAQGDAYWITVTPEP